jgi:hypothetical protein
VKLRISIGDLPSRETEASDQDLDETLGRLGAPEGAACTLTCDCRIGLFCRGGVCAPPE